MLRRIANFFDSTKPQPILFRECNDPSKCEFRGTGRAPVYNINHGETDSMFPFQFKISDWAGVAFLGILTSKWYILTSHTHSVNVYTLCTKNCEIFQTLTALALGYLRCAEIFTLSLSLTGLLLSALNVLSSSSQAPRSGRGALRRGPERGLFLQNFEEKISKF